MAALVPTTASDATVIVARSVFLKDWLLFVPACGIAPFCDSVNTRAPTRLDILETPGSINLRRAARDDVRSLGLMGAGALASGRGEDAPAARMLWVSGDERGQG